MSDCDFIKQPKQSACQYKTVLCKHIPCNIIDEVYEKQNQKECSHTGCPDIDTLSCISDCFSSGKAEEDLHQQIVC